MMQQRDLEPNAITYSTAISAYEEAKQPDTQPSVHVRRQAASQGSGALADMQQIGLVPDVIT